MRHKQNRLLLSDFVITRTKYK